MEVDFGTSFNVVVGLTAKSITTLEKNPDAELLIYVDNNFETTARLCDELKTAIRASKTGPIKLTFAMQASQCKLKVDGPFLKYLLRTLGEGIQMWVSVTDLTCYLKRIGTRTNELITTSDGGLPEWRSGGNINNPAFFTFFKRSKLNKTLPDNMHMLACTALVSIRFIGSLSQLYMPVHPANKSGSGLKFNERILSDEFQTDMEITAANGKKISCHKIFLTGNSAVFEKMLEGQSFVEGQTHSIVLEDMSEMGVWSLLRYFYCDDVESADKDFDICLELMEASEKYGVEKLQQRMKSIIWTKPDEWFNVDSTLRLFCFTRNLPHSQEIKQVSARVLKSKHAELQGSEIFMKLFKENSEAAMDLCCAIAALRE